jgi:hypothetical protein
VKGDATKKLNLSNGSLTVNATGTDMKLE